MRRVRHIPEIDSEEEINNESCIAHYSPTCCDCSLTDNPMKAVVA